MTGALARLLPQRGGIRRAALSGPADAAALMAALPIAVAMLDAENRFRYVNQEAEAFFGLSASHLQHLSLADLVAADSPLFLLLEAARRDEVSIADHDLTLDGPRLHRPGITVHAAPVPEEPGAVLLALHDASAVRSLDRQMNFLGAARSVSGMAAILAHEVKNPLSGIRGAAQLLESSVGPEDRELAVLIRDEADRIRALVDRMEVFGDRPAERGPVNIHRVLGHVRRLAASGFAAGVRITESYDPSLPAVRGNRDQLVQVFLNLVKNACEAIGTTAGHGMADRGEIVLTTAYQHGVRMAVPGRRRRTHLPLVVTVRDNGPGIPEDVQPHLFEPFVTTRAAGKGLGLALVAKLVGDHGGLVEADSRPGRTEFRIFLPMAPDDGCPPEAEDAEAEGVEPGSGESA